MERSARNRTDQFGVSGPTVLRALGRKRQQVGTLPVVGPLSVHEMPPVAKASVLKPLCRKGYPTLNPGPTNNRTTSVL